MISSWTGDIHCYTPSLLTQHTVIFINSLSQTANLLHSVYLWLKHSNKLTSQHPLYSSCVLFADVNAGSPQGTGTGNRVKAKLKIDTERN